MLFRCASSLLSLSQERAVPAVLAGLGESSGADRVWLLRYNDDGTLFRISNAWCREGITELCSDLQDVPVLMLAWLQERLIAGLAVMVERVTALPKCARELRLEFQRQENRSVLCVPVFREGRLWGCVGYDAVGKERRWGAASARLLYQCGHLIAEAERWSSTQRPVPAAAADSGGCVYLHSKDGSVQVEIAEIIGVKAERDYTRVYFSGGRSALELKPLKTWLSLLPKRSFLRIHRGAIVNLRCITGTRLQSGGSLAVILADVGEWSVSRTYRAGLRSRLGGG